MDAYRYCHRDFLTNSIALIVCSGKVRFNEEAQHITTSKILPRASVRCVLARTTSMPRPQRRVKSRILLQRSPCPVPDRAAPEPPAFGGCLGRSWRKPSFGRFPVAPHPATGRAWHLVSAPALGEIPHKRRSRSPQRGSPLRSFAAQRPKNIRLKICRLRDGVRQPGTGPAVRSAARTGRHNCSAPKRPFQRSTTASSASCKQIGAAW